MVDGVISRLAGIEPGSALAGVLAERREIFERSQASHDALLTPHDPGGLSRALRAALAARSAAMHGAEESADHYRALFEADPGATPELRRLCDPAELPQEGDRWLAAVVRHADLLTLRPQDSGAEEIEALRAGGVVEEDIVRLTQLAGFVSYQVRMVATLRLLAGGQG